MLVFPALRVVQLHDYVQGTVIHPTKEIDETGKVVNWEYVQWAIRDQHIQVYLVSSLSRDIQSQVVARKTVQKLGN